MSTENPSDRQITCGRFSIHIAMRFLMMKVTFFGTTTLLFDDGKDQILFDAHFTRPSIEKDEGR